MLRFEFRWDVDTGGVEVEAQGELAVAAHRSDLVVTVMPTLHAAEHHKTAILFQPDMAGVIAIEATGTHEGVAVVVRQRITLLRPGRSLHKQAQQQECAG